MPVSCGVGIGTVGVTRPEILLYVIRGTSPAGACFPSVRFQPLVLQFSCLPGMRVFRFRRSRNPLQPTSQGGTWNFGTYADLHPCSSCLKLCWPNTMRGSKAWLQSRAKAHVPQAESVGSGKGHSGSSAAAKISWFSGLKVSGSKIG